MNRIELYRGNLIEIPTPTGIYIKSCQFLVYQFRRFFAAHNLPLVAIVTTAVRTEEDSSRIPDVVICTRSLWKSARNLVPQCWTLKKNRC
ncbi:Uma2 family endonuclease [Microcoleus sp. herbarium8]|uniref:Uma2 family endonuclease n=1 Tax=Microcoleus sp. herbarium8 TaxID=3055436 RepID=UPI002FD77B20